MLTKLTKLHCANYKKFRIVGERYLGEQGSMLLGNCIIWLCEELSSPKSMFNYNSKIKICPHSNHHAISKLWATH